MKRQWILLIAAFACLTLFTLVALHRNNSGIQTCPINLVRLPENPIRISSLAPNITEILFALGLDEKIVAVSSDSDYPPEAATKIKTGTFWQPNTEAIISSKPDFVITEWFEQQKAVANTLSNLGYKVLTLRLEKIEELFSAIKEIGEATGCREQAGALSASISDRLDSLRAKVSDANKVKTLWVVQAEPLRVAGRNTFVNELIELAGGENAIGQTLQQYPPLSSEEVLACKAEVIIQSAMGTTGIAEQQQSAKVFWSKFAGLPAVQNSRIYVADSDTILRLGPRLPQGCEQVARYLHPELFEKR